MHPFVALMRRYSIDYTNSHDLSVCDEIMEPDYVVHISGWSLVRDAAYKPAVELIFAQFPGLCLAIHDIITNGDRLAMRFSEHAADVEGRCCAWAGVSLYRWNGSKLTECRVEQDFLSRQRQLTTGTPEPLEPPHHDPWTTTRPVAADEGSERVATEWLRKGDLSSFAAVVEPSRVDIHDLFSAGPRVAFHASVTGSYVGGLPDADEHRGKEARLDFAGIVTVAGTQVRDVQVVADRLGTWSRLTGKQMF